MTDKQSSFLKNLGLVEQAVSGGLNLEVNQKPLAEQAGKLFASKSSGEGGSQVVIGGNSAALKSALGRVAKLPSVPSKS